MANQENILEIRDLHKNFFIKGQKIEVLSGVNLNVKKGELVAIVGASGWGAGKRSFSQMQYDLPGGQTVSLAERTAEYRIRDSGFHTKE